MPKRPVKKLVKPKTKKASPKESNKSVKLPAITVPKIKSLNVSPKAKKMHR